MKKLKTTVERCEGCRSYMFWKRVIPTCILYPFNKKEGDCPCSECLIKVICSKGCPEYSIWYAECRKFMIKRKVENEIQNRKKL